MKLFTVIAFTMLFVGTGCSQSEYQKIGVKEAQTLISTPNSQLQIVDLRTPREIAATGVIPGAELMDFNAPNFKQQIQQLDKSRPVLLYCASGMRSAQAAAMIDKQKFKSVYEMSPGMNGWLAAGNKTVKVKQ
jgi:rhodanese-related sulfurtransferase